MKVPFEYKQLFRIILITCLIFLAIAPLRSGAFYIGYIGGFKLSSIVGFFVGLFLTIYFFKEKKLSNWCIIIGLFVGISFFTLPMHIIYFSGTKVSLLEYLIHLSSIILGWIYSRMNMILYKLFILTFSFIFCFWTSTTGYNLWLNKLNFGTFTGGVSNNIKIKELTSENETGDTVFFKKFEDKYLLLDCWYTHCGSCYAAMPKVQRLYDEYKSNSNIQIYTLHSRMQNETYFTGYDILKEEGYSLPTLSININDPNLKELGVKVYPTVLIFNTKSELIFRGNIDFAEKYLEKVLNDLN